ncbi:epidermal growth factor receptor kinase substrate 8-like isoform X2 [Tachypleus tridentatus]|uniref:epidermal growth factor receptor kinase substrate 8-like isoform X2 n=1 Tax=Tachypleus tridentatus TaxID=6853 RepID=UPI003FD11A98
MPGVIVSPYIQNSQNSQQRFGSYPDRREMSPHRQDSDMRASRSSFANGYGSDQQSDQVEDGPLYLLEHLATFSVGSEFGLESPKDGLRRLLQMEKSTGIWTQKMQLKLDRRWVVIKDYENGDVVEKFPMNLISDPTSFISNDSREIYNNVLIFIVREDSRNKLKNSGEMHIFQCVRVSAQDVVEEMRLFMNGKWKPGYRSTPRPIPPPPSNPPPNPPLNGRVRDHVNLFNAAAAAAASVPQVPRNSQTKNERQEQTRSPSHYSREIAEEPTSVGNERYEKEVMMLNCCFDDIEIFVGRLQHAAAAYQELERRQKSRKNKKKDLGDGILSMRAKPPSEREFIEVLQKFKFSFNLLAKLKNHIHDPNAPELIHFLFTPLTLVVDAAQQTGSNLPPQVVTPLLTADAIDLLVNCCSSKETDLWHSLGDPWIIPRDQWRGNQASYHPVFTNGWAPEYPFSDDRERAGITAAAAASAAQRYRRDNLRRAQEEAELRNQDYLRQSNSQLEREGHYDIDYYSSDRDQRPMSEQRPANYSNHFYDAPPPDVLRKAPYMDRSGANTPSDQDFHDRETRSDISTSSAEHGMIPTDALRQFERQQRPWFEDIRARGNKCVVVLYPRTANNDKELTVVKGELLELLDDSRKWWRARNMRGQVGYIPSTIIAQYQGPSSEDEIFSNPLYSRAGPSRNNFYNSPNESSPVQERRIDSSSGPSSSSYRGPSHHPIPTPATADWIQRERMGKKDSAFNTALSRMDSPDRRKQRNNRFLPLWTTPERSGFMTIQPEPVMTPLPPPLPPPSFTATASDVSKYSAVKIKQEVHPKTTNTRDLFQEELRERLTLGHKAKKKLGLIQQSNLAAVYITADSTPVEVQHWLEAKDYSPEACQLFKEMNGKRLFELTRSQLEEMLGVEVGSRLHGHIAVQKNMSGYKTMSGQELQSILAQRRKKVENANESKETFGS